MGPKYHRVLLKISGEALKTGISVNSSELYNYDYIDEVVRVIKKCLNQGVQMGIIIGGGNIWRGRSGGKMDRCLADQMGMLATVMNCICLHDVLTKFGIDSRVMTSLPMDAFSEFYTKEKAIYHLEKGRVVLFGCGIGAPYFSTDTPAVLRAKEIDADVLMMAKAIDGVYSSDPLVYSDAVRFDEISYTDILTKNLRVIDMTAAALARDTGVVSYLFGLKESDNIYKVIMGEKIGTIVKE